MRQVPLDDESRKVLESACEGLPGRFQEGGFVVQGEGAPGTSPGMMTDAKFGKQNYGKSPFLMGKSKWHFSIAMLDYQMVCPTCLPYPLHDLHGFKRCELRFAEIS